MGASQNSMFLFFCNGPLWLAFYTKIMILLILPKYNIFCQYGTMVVLHFNHLYIIQEQNCEQRMWDKLWCYSREYLGCTFLGAFCLTSLLEYNFYFLTLFIVFSPRVLQKLEYLLSSIWISLIRLYCIPKQKCF